MLGRLLDRVCDSKVGFFLVAYLCFCVVAYVSTALFFGGFAVVWLLLQGLVDGLR